MPESLCQQQTKGDACKVDRTCLRTLCIADCSAVLYRSFDDWFIRVQEERCLKCTNRTSQDSSNLHIWQPNCGFKFCSSPLYSGGNTERWPKEMDRTVSICGIWNVELLWNTIERSPSQSLICRASNLLRFRSALNYFWASQCFISGGAWVFCDFCQSLHLQATYWVKK
jgi:ferredoxin-like protein FixX